MANINNNAIRGARGGWLGGTALVLALLALVLGVYLYYRKINLLDMQEFATFPAGLKDLYKSLIIDKVMAPIGTVVSMAYNKNSKQFDSQIRTAFNRITADPKVKRFAQSTPLFKK